MLDLQLDNRIRNILSCIHAGVLYCKNDEYSTILYANDYFYEIVGYSKEEVQTLFQNRFAEMVIDDMSEIILDINASIARGEDLDFEYWMRHKNGREIWIHHTAKYDKEYNCFYVTLMDITKKKKIELEKEQLYRYLEYVPNKIVISNEEGKITYKNKKARECTYYNASVHTLQDIIDHHMIGMQSEEVYNKIRLGENVSYETRFKDTTRFIGHDVNHLVPVYDNRYKTWNYMQVSENVVSNSDTLTNFPVRSMFEKYYETIMNHDRPENVHLCIIDIDDFKCINDTFGHLIGDLAIIHTASHLANLMDKKDYVCRFGGDEFLFLMVDKDKETVIEKLKTLSSVQHRRMVVEGEVIELSYSIGISCTYGKKVPYQILLQDADEALYTVKQNGKNNMIYSSKCF